MNAFTIIGMLTVGLGGFLVIIAFVAWSIDFIDRVNTFKGGERLEEKVEELTALCADLEAEHAVARAGGPYRSGPPEGPGHE